MKRKTYGFGFDPADTLNFFYVILPPANPDPVRVYEGFAWDEENKQVVLPEDVLRLEISRHKWGLVSRYLTTEFNNRLRKDQLTAGKFIIGKTPLEKLFGKEMMLLLWGIEDVDPSNIPTAIRNWRGFMPEERWWLYTMTNASCGGFYDKKGWRTALRYILCENPVSEKPQLELFDEMVIKGTGE